MDPAELVRSIYLGDRACKAVLIESWENRVAIQVDVISRIKADTAQWNFYNDEDMVDGWLVFSGVSEFSFTPSGLLPNDLINSLTVEQIDGAMDQPVFRFEMAVDSVDARGNATEVIIKVDAKALELKASRQV